eukprot:1020399-Prymnesium_polylepis.1
MLTFDEPSTDPCRSAAVSTTEGQVDVTVKAAAEPGVTAWSPENVASGLARIRRVGRRRGR